MQQYKGLKKYEKELGISIPLLNDAFNFLLLRNILMTLIIEYFLV